MRLEQAAQLVAWDNAVRTLWLLWECSTDDMAVVHTLREALEGHELSPGAAVDPESCSCSRSIPPDLLASGRENLGGLAGGIAPPAGPGTPPQPSPVHGCCSTDAVWQADSVPLLPCALPTASNVPAAAGAAATPVVTTAGTAAGLTAPTPSVTSGHAAPVGAPGRRRFVFPPGFNSGPPSSWWPQPLPPHERHCPPSSAVPGRVCTASTPVSARSPSRPPASSPTPLLAPSLVPSPASPPALSPTASPSTSWPGPPAAPSSAPQLAPLQAPTVDPASRSSSRSIPPNLLATGRKNLGGLIPGQPRYAAPAVSCARVLLYGCCVAGTTKGRACSRPGS